MANPGVGLEVMVKHSKCHPRADPHKSKARRADAVEERTEDVQGAVAAAERVRVQPRSPETSRFLMRGRIPRAFFLPNLAGAFTLV